LSDAVIYRHLAGEHTVGVYPLLEDDTCYFLAADFDEADWREDALAFMQSCEELGVPAALEISRSGKGAHAWVFFDSRVSARDARRLVTVIISHTCSRTRELKLESYDRLFPNQDTMPKGGFGNQWLRMLFPLQGQLKRKILAKNPILHLAVRSASKPPHPGGGFPCPGCGDGYKIKTMTGCGS